LSLPKLRRSTPLTTTAPVFKVSLAARDVTEVRFTTYTQDMQGAQRGTCRGTLTLMTLVFKVKRCARRR
jgi:hypothetical protein